MAEVDTDVLVAGAGPTGLTLACVLAQWGVRVRVLDAAPEPFRGSRAKGLQPRSLEVFDGLGVAQRVIGRGRFRVPIRRYAGVHDRIGVVVDSQAGREPTPDRPWVRTLMTAQWCVEEALRERLADLGVAVEQSRAVTGLEQDGSVTATLADGSSVTARYLAGCDGGASTVRHLLGVPFLGETRDEIRMLLADVVLDGLDRDHWHHFGTPGPQPFAMLCPLPATDTFQLQAAVPAADPGTALTPELAQAVVDAVTTDVRVRAVRWWSRWRLNVRMVDRYRVGRCFLAGDAAHVHSPAGGQGMNTGIQDAVNLGWKLAAVLGGADAGLLDTYEAERLRVAAGVLGLSSTLTMRPFERSASEAERTTQLDLTYRGGPLAPDPGDGPARPGDRAPEAPGRAPDGAPVRLFDLFRPDARGPHWTLVGFGAPPPHVDGAVRPVTVLAPGDPVPPGGGAVLVDVDGHAGAAYGGLPGEVLAVRPDGYVGARGTDPAAVVAQLRGLLPSITGHLGRRGTMEGSRPEWNP